MRLPRPGTTTDELKCKICGKTAKDQDNDISKCVKEHCPYDRTDDYTPAN